MKKWVGVIGTREVDDEIREKLRSEVAKYILRDFGIVSGGGTGADHEAAKTAFEMGADLKIFLPTTLNDYEKGLLARAKRGRCNENDAIETIELLRKIKNESPEAIIEPSRFSEVDAQALLARNHLIVDQSDEILAFRINESSGTTYTCDLAKKRGKSVQIFDFMRDDVNY